MNPFDLTGTTASSTYVRLLQTVNGFVYDGLGNTFSFGSSSLTLNDSVISATSGWSSNKINNELDLKLDDSQLNDAAATSSTTSLWSVNKIYTELQAIEASDIQINDSVIATGSVWSSDKINDEIQGLSSSVNIRIDSLSSSVDINTTNITGLSQSIGSVSISVANLLNDSITGSTTGWTSEKINSELELKLDDSQLNDAAATSSTTSLWSVNKIYTELQAIENNDLQINDLVIATDSVWSSDKTNTEIQGLSSSVNTRIDTVSVSVIGLSNSVDSLSLSVANIFNDNIIGNTTGWTSDKINSEIQGLSSSVNTRIDTVSVSVIGLSQSVDSVSISVANLLNDSITGSTTGWSSEKIDNELDLKLDDSQLNDAAATSSTTSLWSVNKIYNELQAIEASDLQINDLIIATDSVWSSDKIESEIQGLSSSVNTKIDTVSASVIGLSQSVDSLSASVDNNSVTITGLSQSIDSINVTISNIENDIDSVSISVANLLNDSITGSTTGWTSEKINNELELKLDDSQLNDTAATSSTTSLWSVNKIYTELQAIEASDIQINDSVIATGSVWSSDKTNSEIQGLSSSVNTRIDTVSASVIDNTNTITGLSQSIDSVSISVSNLLNDSITGSTTGWTSEKINSELELKLDDSQLNDAAATSSTTSLWSVNKIYNELQAIEASDLQINDLIIATDSVWSSDKINSEIQGLSSSVNTRIDTVSSSVIGLSQSIDIINVTISNIDGNIIGLSNSIDSLSASVDINTTNITGLSQSIDSVSVSVSNLLNDSITGSTTGWSSQKISSELDLKLDDSQLNDAAATSSTTSLWSVNKIYTELQAIEANDLQINDLVVATDSLWSSDKTNTEIQGLSSSVNTRIDTVSASVIDNTNTITGLSQSVDSLSLSVIDNTNGILGLSNSIDSLSLSVVDNTTTIVGLSNSIDSVSISVANLLNDSITGSTTGWSSQKISNELDLKLDDSQLNDNAATSSTTSLWSVNKIYNELQAIEASDLQINDLVIATDSVWSSDKINSEIQGLSSSVNTRIDTVSASVIDNTNNITGLSQSVDTINVTISNIEGDIVGLSQSVDSLSLSVADNTTDILGLSNSIDSVSISVSNLLNDSITGSTTGWSSQKIDSELDLKLDDSQLNDAAATSSTTSLWSVNKIYTELQAIDANDLQINDLVIATDSVWSSDKINSEVQGLSSSVNTRIDTISSSVIGLSQSIDTINVTISNIEGDIIGLSNSIDSVSISVANLLNDSITGSTTGWSSQKIANELEFKLDDSQLNDLAATSSTTSLWSVNKIYTELQLIEANDLQINDAVTATNSVWSSDKIDSEIQGLSSSVNNRIDTVSASVFGLSQSVDSLSLSVFGNTTNILGLSQSIDSVSISVSNLLNDSITGSTTGWTSQKIANELELKLDDSQLNDAAATSSTTSLWSVNKIYNELQAIENNDLQINDAVIATNSVWSSDKIDSEIQGLSSSVNTRIDTVSSSVIGLSQSVDSLSASVNNNSITITGLSQSIDIINVTISNIENDIDSVSISVANLLNDSITGSTTGWSSEKIDSELDLKLDDSQLNDAAATSSTTSLWSVNKIYNELQAIDANDLQINDNITATDSVWSSDKTNTEIQGLSSSVNTRIDTVSSSVIGLSQSVDSLSLSVFDNTNNITGLSNSIDSVSISVANLLNDSITGSTTGWSSEKINNELDLKLDDSQLNDFSATSSTTSVWSANKIYSELLLLESERVEIYNSVITTGFNTTPQRVTLDQTRVNSSPTLFNVSNSEITINSDVNTMVSYRVSTEITSGANRSTSAAWLEIDSGLGFTEVIGSRVFMYNRTDGSSENTGSANLMLDLKANEVLRVRVQRISGSDTLNTIINGCNLSIVDLKGGRPGEKGDIGPTGPSGGPVGPTGSNGYGVFAFARVAANGTQLSSRGFSSIVRSSTGVYDYTFTTPSNDSNYVVVGLPHDTTSADDPNVFVINTTVNGFQVRTARGDNGGTADVLSDIEHSISVINPSGGLQGITSAYESWLNIGNVGTEGDFINDLVGATGATGPIGSNIDDLVIATESTWSSDKIDSEIQGLSSSVNTRIDTVSASVIGLSQSINIINVTVSNIEGDIIGLSNSVDSLSASVDINTINITGLSQSIDSVSISVSNILNDSITGSTTGWTSEKINNELELKLDDSQLNDAAATSSTTSLWSVNKIYTELQAIEANDLQINDLVIATDSVWSSDKIDSEIQGLSSSVNTRIDTVSASVIDNTNTITGLSQSIDSVSISVANLLNDSITGSTTGWTSQKINDELDLKLDDSQLNDTITTSTNLWSAEKINTELNTITVSISDLENELDSLSSSTVTIDDNIIATNSVWSSNKINSELDTITLSVSDLENELDSLSSSVALNTAKETNVPTSLSLGTISATALGITSDGGVDDVIIPTATTTTAGLLQASDKDKLDNIEANATADQIASEVPYTPATASEWLTVPTDVKQALDSLSSRTGDYGEKIITESTTTTNAEYFSFTTNNLVAGQYEILVSYVMSHSSISTNARFRCQVDNTQDIFNPGGDGWHEFEPADPGTDKRDPKSGHRVVTLSAGTHQIDFDYGRGDTLGTVFMYSVHITVKKL